MFVKYILIGLSFALDITDSFTPWVQDNLAKQYRMFESRGNRILEVKVKKESPDLEIQRQSKMYFVQFKDGPENCWTLIPQTRKNKGTKGNSDCHSIRRIEISGRDKITVWRGNFCHIYNKTTSDLDIAQQKFHPGIPFQKLRCWQKDGNKYIVSVHDRKTNKIISFMQGDPDCLETLKTIETGISADGWSEHKSSEVTPGYMRYKQGYRLKYSVDGTTFLSLTRIANAKLPNILAECINRFSPELKLYAWGNPNKIFAFKSSSTKRESQPHPLKITRRRSGIFLKGLAKLHEEEGHEQSQHILGIASQSARQRPRVDQQNKS